MEARKKGAIINVASGAAFTPQPFMTMYSATKAYVDFFSRSLSYECSDKGITVQCVCPGKVSFCGVELSWSDYTAFPIISRFVIHICISRLSAICVAKSVYIKKK